MEENKTGRRVQWVDLVKGLCIISVVLGHASAFVIYVYMFHMAAFFILSGYTYHGEKYTWLGYLKKKFLTLVVPIVLINVLYFCFYEFAERCGFYSLIATSTYSGFFNGIRGLFSRNMAVTELGGATWFLIVLFLAEILFKTIQCCLNNHRLDCAVAVLLGIVGYYLGIKQIYLPCYFDLGLYACLYFAIGVLLNRYKEKLPRVNKLFAIFCCLGIVFVFKRYYFTERLPMNWPTRQFDIPAIQILTILACFYLCYMLSLAIQKEKHLTAALTYIGRHTYVIIVTHFAVFRLIAAVCVLTKLLPASALLEFPLATALVKYWLPVTAATIALCMLAAWIAEKNVVLNYIVNASLPWKKEKHLSVF